MIKEENIYPYTVTAASLYTLCSNTRLFTLYWRIVLAYRKEKGVLFVQIFLLLPKPLFPFLLIPSSYSIHYYFTAMLKMVKQPFLT